MSKLHASKHSANDESGDILGQGLRNRGAPQVPPIGSDIRHQLRVKQNMAGAPFPKSELPGLAARRGKVRDVYDLGETLLLVATDRISAFDWVLPTAIPDKGRILTQTSLFWFEYLGIPHHVLSADVDDMPLPSGADRDSLRGRTLLCRKANVIPMECVVRGYLAGSGWVEYQATQSVGGVPLPAGLQESSLLAEPIFTPATKAEMGEHDENISFATMAERIGEELASELARRSLEIYTKGATHARSKGILLADTKFEFGFVGSELLLVDEVLTPDSSRFWPADSYAAGRAQQSFDKQFVRDWLLASDWDRQSPPPPLPEDVVCRTREKYVEAYERLTGREFAWK
jgi:phosphoribosylaminoimidazole-succinocarboxamide synthase